MRTKVLILGLICFFIFICCEEKIENPHSSDSSKLLDLPTIKYFNVNPTEILCGESIVLRWHVSNASYYNITDNNAWRLESSGLKAPWDPCDVELHPKETTTYVLTALNYNGTVKKSCMVEVSPGFVEVVMTHGPTGQSYVNYYHVTGGVKNIGSLPAFNTKVSIELWGSYGNLLASGECMVGGDGFRFEPQYSAGWLIEFSGDIYYILDRNMGSGSEITYEITWDELH